MRPPPLVLASASPRRRRLLEQLALCFDVMPAEVDERERADESGSAHVRRLALLKARTVAQARQEALVIGGDTVVTVDGEILGKPVNEGEAAEMLLRLQGDEHRVQTGVAMVAPDGREMVESVGVDVRFRTFDRAVAEAYVATGEPLDKAGGYAIQGLGAVLVHSIRGDYSAVVGLPVGTVVEMLRGLGWEHRFQRDLVPAGRVE